MNTMRVTTRKRMLVGCVLPLVAVVLLAGCSLKALNDTQRAELRDGTSGYQQRVLEDLIVSESEYRQSVVDWRECVLASGAAASEIEENDNTLSFGYTVERPTEAELNAINLAADACLTDYHDAIGRVWVSQGAELT